MLELRRGFSTLVLFIFIVVLVNVAETNAKAGLLYDAGACVMHVHNTYMYIYKLADVT